MLPFLTAWIAVLSQTDPGHVSFTHAGADVRIPVSTVKVVQGRMEVSGSDAPKSIRVMLGRRENSWEEWYGAGEASVTGRPGEGLNLTISDWRVESDADGRLRGRWTATCPGAAGAVTTIEGKFDYPCDLPRPKMRWNSCFFGLGVVAVLVLGVILRAKKYMKWMMGE